MTMNNFIKISLLTFLCSVLAVSCSWWGDSSDESVEQVLSVAAKSPSADFTQYRTFCITDSILYTNGDKSNRVRNTVAERLLNKIRGEFEDCGYIYEENAKDVDLIVDVSYIISTTTTFIYDPYLWWDWSYWWDWYYYPCYYPFYPYYPFMAPVYYSSYSAGMVIIDAVDMTVLEERNPIVWHGVTRAILETNPVWEDVVKAVEQCFEMLPPVVNPVEE